MPDNNILLLPKQILFMRSTARGTIFRAGIGSGKTRILCYKAIENARAGRRECIVSHSYTMLRDVILHTMLIALELHGMEAGHPTKGYILNKTDMHIRIGKGEILMRSAENPDALRGLNLDDFLMDEARMLKTRELFDILLGRIRNSETAKWYICSTPHGKDWAWKLSQDPAVNLIIQKTDENTFLPKTWLADVRSNFTSKYAQQELDAEILEYEGLIIKSSWFRPIPYIKQSSGVRFWDIAVTTKKASDFSAGALCVFKGSTFCISDIRHGQWKYPALRHIIIETAKSDGPGVIIGLEQVGQQMAIVDDLRATPELREYTIKVLKPRGDKLARAMPWASQAELGNITAMEGPWRQNFFDECDAFSGTGKDEYDDTIDAVSGAYHLMAKRGNAQFVNLYV